MILALIPVVYKRFRRSSSRTTEKLFGPTSPALAASLTWLAAAHRATGRSEAAEALIARGEIRSIATQLPIAADPAKPSRVPEGLWVKCENCKEIVYRKEIEKNLDQVLLFVQHIRSRITRYSDFLRKAREDLAGKAKAHPELKESIAALAPDPAQLRAKLEEELQKRERLLLQSQREVASRLFERHSVPLHAGGGLEHANSTALGYPRFGFKIQSGDRATSASPTASAPERDYRGFLSLVSHEFFHSWNVERIRPRSLEPFSFEDANMSGELWLAEGFTSYYGPLILARAGGQPFYLEEILRSLIAGGVLVLLAGLFGSGEDLLRFGEWLLAVERSGGQGGSKVKVRPPVLREFTRRQNVVPGASRALGWDTPSSGSSAGTRLDSTSFGHTGFTGTSMWIDPTRELVVVLLTNRVHPTRDNPGIYPLRSSVADRVVTLFSRYDR